MYRHPHALLSFYAISTASAPQCVSVHLWNPVLSFGKCNNNTSFTGSSRGGGVGNELIDMKAASSQQGSDTWLLRAYSHPHPNMCVSLFFPVYPLLQLLPVGAHDLRLLPIPELVHGARMAHACLLRYMDPDYVCHKNASGSWQIYWGNCISSYACRSLPGDKLWELCALKKKKRFGKLILVGDWVIKWLPLLSFLLNLFLSCVIPLMEGLRQASRQAKLLLCSSPEQGQLWKISNQSLLSPPAPSSSPLTRSLNPSGGC